MRKYIVTFKETILSEVRVLADDPQQAAFLAAVKKARADKDDVRQINYSVEITPELLMEIK